MAECMQLRGVGHHAGPRLLFRDLDLVLGDRDRIGLIGPNGAGKSTLLRILAGRETPREGRRSLRRGLRIACLDQEPGFGDARTPLEYLLARFARDPKGPPGVDPEVAARSSLQRAGFEDPTRALDTLSGGWRRRLAVVAEWATRPDLLLLDEPTNHMDLAGIEWLEATLLERSGALVVISHDRRFLEALCTKVLEIDRAYPDGWMLEDGSYSRFLEKRTAARQAQNRMEESLAAVVREDIRYLRQGAKARTSKSASRVARAHEHIDQLETLQRRNEARRIEGAFQGTGRRTKRLLSAEEIDLRRGDRELLSRASFVLSPGRRLGLVGPNGSGKSSLLLALLGELPLAAGELRQAPDLRVVHFDQQRELLDEETTVGRTLAPDGDKVRVRGRTLHLKSWTRQLGFSDEQVDQPVKSLSGGERARLLMGRLMGQEADLLLLDEPTNDLDLDTLEMLERSLLDFAGAVVLVTHDRLLLDRVCTSLLALRGDGAWAEVADREQWERWKREAPRSLEPRKESREATEAPRKRPTKLSYLEQREFDGLESEILEAESELADRQTRLADPAVQESPADLARVGREVAELQARVDALYARWSELDEKQRRLR